MDRIALPMTTSPEPTFELMTSTILTLRQFLTVSANERQLVLVAKRYNSHINYE